MSDETKVPPAGGTRESPASTPRPPGESSPAGSKPAAGAPKAPGAAAAKPPAPPKPVVQPEPWTSPLLQELQSRFPGAISDPLIFRSQPFFTVSKQALLDVCEFLKTPEGGEYIFLTDETAVDYPKREKRFEIIYQLYSFKRNDRLRMKLLSGDGETVPSVAGVWATANWLEREIYDMFGVVFDGHPDLKRLLLPLEWVGHPLRKDYDILRQDEAWVKANLGIESGQ